MNFENTSLPYYSQFIHISRYSRWIPSLSRRETYTETVKRYIDFWRNRFPKIASSVFDELELSILTLETMPSMRAMMTAGLALERDNMTGYNCLGSETKVLTKEYGLIAIKDIAQKYVHVLDANRDWTRTQIRLYGYDTLFNLRFRLNSNTWRDIEATPNHRWHLIDGSIKSTSELSKGDQIKFIAANRPKISEDSLDYKYGIIHGLIYGDGTTTYSCNRTKGYHVRLCSDTLDLSKWFKGYPVCYPKYFNGDPLYMLYDEFAKTHPLKELPDENETDDYMVGFFRGWLAADGSVSKEGQVSICMGREDKNWFNRIAPKYGFVVQNEFAETNFGERKNESWRLSISRSSLLKEDFIITRKADKFEELESKWTYDHLSNETRNDKVYCCEVSTTQSFAIDAGLLTGNCSFTSVSGKGKELNILTDEMKELNFEEPIKIQLKTPISFDEIFYILLCGTGVGYSVERQFISNLPTVGKFLDRSIYRRTNKNYPGVSTNELSKFDRKTNTVYVADSKYGWASALRIILVELYNGNFKIKWNTSKVRPAGSLLKTFGGRASGPEPLENLFSFCVQLFTNCNGRKLTSYEAHSLICKIADIVVVGGIRRSALLSLSNLSDQRLGLAKSGQWWLENPHFALANNSVAYTEKPDIAIWMKEWLSLIESRSGERGIFNRNAAKKQVEKIGRRDPNYDWGCNPCLITNYYNQK